MGNVLIYYKPRWFIDRFELSDADKDLLLKEIFQSKEWTYLDNGNLTESEMCQIVKSRIPSHLHQIMEDLIMAWDQPLLEINHMPRIIRNLKLAGYKIYLLSNASLRQKEYWPRIAASKYFDGVLVSATVNQVKPNPDIYHTLFNKFDIKPEESFFINDSRPNIVTSRRLGMEGFVFEDNPLDLEKKLIEILPEYPDLAF